MEMTFAQIESYIARLPIDDRTYEVFEALLEQPYDVFRPLMDMLFDGTIVVEDLMAAPGTSIASASAIRDDSMTAEAHLGYAGLDFATLGKRFAELASGRIPPSMAVVDRDQSALAVEESGRPGGLFSPSVPAVVGTDANAYAPNPIEVARAGSAEAARKAAQERFIAAVQPENE